MAMIKDRFLLYKCVKRSEEFGFPTASTRFIGYEMLLKVTEKINRTQFKFTLNI